MKNVYHSLKQYFMFEKPNFLHLPPYFCITIKPDSILLQIIDNDTVFEEETFSLEGIEDFLKFLNEYKNFPIYLVLKDCDIIIKHLDLKNATWLNKYFIRQEFQKGEYKEKELFFCQRSSVVDGLYRFISLQYNEKLDQLLKIIASNVKNLFIGIDLEEVSFLKELSKKTQNQTILPFWRMILTVENDHWKMLIGYKSDLILVRQGIIPSNALIDSEAYFIKEIVDTTKYLKRLGWNEELKIAFYADPKYFKKQSLSNYHMILNDISTLSDIKIHPSYFFERLNNSLKSLFSFDFYKKRITCSYFFLHHFFYKLPQYVINIVSPLVIFASGFCLIYGLKISYLKYAILNIDGQMQQISPLQKEEEERYVKSKNFLFFKTHYTKNPIIVIKSIHESLLPTIIAEKVDWFIENERVKISFQLKEKTKNKKQNYGEMKEKVEENIHKKIPSFTPQWQKGPNNFITLNLVGPK
ncbi:MAG: hypothetical protein KBD31_04515 [Proteobacteria bacterium]|nr:hypothetical protein [Pseudomonadota bacterium]